MMLTQNTSGIIYHGIGLIFKGINCIEINHNFLPPPTPYPHKKEEREKSTSNSYSDSLVNKTVAYFHVQIYRLSQMSITSAGREWRVGLWHSLSHVSELFKQHFMAILVEDIPLCLKYNDKIKLCMYSSWPLVPKFAGSNPAEAFGFFRAKKSSARLPSEGK